MRIRGQAAKRRAERIYDLLSDGDKDSAELIAALGCSHKGFLKAVQELRDLLSATGDSISVICEPNGERQPWLYGLRAGNQLLNAEDSRWIANRFQDAERRIKTMAHVLDAAASGLDGRTSEGKKARIYRLHINRALEEIRLTTDEQLEMPALAPVDFRSA